jgi:peptide/nickel transport system permease protein
MFRAIAYRLVGVIPVLLLVSALLYGLLWLAPGDAATLLVPEDATPDEVALIRARWGLDRSIFEQYWSFLTNALQFDFGRSFRYGADVADVIASRLPATIELAVAALLVGTLIGVPAGIYAALRKGRLADNIVSVLAIAGVSTPTFWLGILLVLGLSAELGWLPSSGRLPYGAGLRPVTGLHTVDAILAGNLPLLGVVLSHLALPALTLGFNMMGIITRVTRAAIIEVGQEEFITTAVAKGLSRKRIVRDHLVPNAAIPITTIIGLELGGLISGSIIVEVVFSWPGIGFLLYQAISVRDMPLVTGVVVMYTFVFIAVNVLIDIVYFMVDPRVRAAEAG